jgi:hypothetical protein
MVPERGLEPPTNCLRSNCSNIFFYSIKSITYRFMPQGYGW